MSPFTKALPLLLLLCGALFGQGTLVDCTPATFTFTSATTGTAVANANTATPCRSWEISYDAPATLTVLSLQFETSPDNSSWTAVPNTICSSTVQPPCLIDGANPSTTTGNQTFSVSAYGRYVRINVTTYTGSGTLTVRIYGYKGLSARTGKGSGGGGGAPTGPAGGDLSGTYPNPNVANLSHVTNASLQNSGLVNPSTTVNGATCTLGASCSPGAAPTGTAGGDLSGSYPNPTVAQVQGAAVPLSATVLGTNASRQLIAATKTGVGSKVVTAVNLPASQPETCTDINGDLTTVGCGAGSNTGNSVTSVTPVTVSANTANEQFLMELSLSAGYLNSSGQPFLINGAFLYTTPIGQTPTLTFKVRLCTVSGCGSGTNIVLGSIVTTATLANSTNNTANISLMSYTATTGATGNLEVHGPLVIDLGALSTSPDTVFNDTNTAVTSNINLTAALFLDFTVQTSSASASNSITQRSGGIMPFAASSGGATSTTISIPLPVAICQGTTGATGLSTPSNNAPVPTCVIGTNTILSELAFPAGALTTFQYHIRVPFNADCTQPWNIVYAWRAASTSGSVTWQIATVFVADGSTVDPSFNAVSTVAHAPQGTTLQIRSDTISGFTKTGCAAGTEMFLQGSRLGTGADTMTGDAQLISATLQIPRTI